MNEGAAVATWMQTYGGLFNYWVVILLMMTGFYIVIGQRNLIKAVIGLNIFQTSVFLLYITMGKVRGGTAPIIQDPVESDHHDASHPSSAEPHDAPEHLAAAESLTESDMAGGHAPDGHVEAIAESAGGHPVTGGHAGTGGHAATGEHDIHDAVGHATDAAGEIIYSNPLPSVLMLTAIVVGIATTALALSLIVRIREAYGTIEEDEILQIDAREDAELASS